MSETSTDVIRMMAEHERLISALYSAYARSVPEKEDFWKRLAAEEIEHSEWLTALLDGGYGDPRAADAFKAEAIRTSAAYVQEATVAADTEGVSHLEALSVAADVEEAMIEKRFFDAFIADSADARKVLDRLERETTEHRKRIERELAVERA
ncbi:MAG: hypothetical protein JXB46_08770 [Candidatus Eisenbacteria bacterium]|nr:hypothetical protein [Candidatus Eisenbacteria bacterium]